MKRSVLPLSYRYLWQIETGLVRSFTWFEDGTPVPLGLWGPGDIVGRSLSKANPYELQCLTPVEAISLPKDRSDQFSDALIMHLQRLEEYLQIVHSKPTEIALLRFLNWLAERYGKDSESGQLIDLHLTHQEIAEMIGSTRVTVTRLFKEFEQQGVIDRLKGKRIILQETQPWWHYEI
jgi:CRP-like cAMP-binding protein